MEMSKDIPCADCDDWKQMLADNDYEVIECTPIGNGFCRIRYRHKPAEPAQGEVPTNAES